jgi:hypothetical protein
MNDSLLVRGLEGLGDLPGNGQRLVERQRTASDTVGQRRALDELHRERRHAGRVLEAVDGAMFGWFSDARTWASRLNLASRSVSCANPSGRTLMATWRPRFVSVARHTTPMPPSPIWAITS